LACNAAEGTCMGYCIGVAAAEAPVTGGLSLLGALASCAVTAVVGVGIFAGLIRCQ
jgi:hypothetical protein